MRTTLACLAALLLVSTDAPEAQSACGLPTPGTSCPDAGRLVFDVDLTPEVKQRILVPEIGRKPVLVLKNSPTHLTEPIDCDMVRWVDPSLDPRIVKRPSETIDHAMRIVEVPACPTPERKIVRIRRE